MGVKVKTIRKLFKFLLLYARKGTIQDKKGYCKNVFKINAFCLKLTGQIDYIL